MGKKGRKTRWRRLPIGGPESAAAPPLEEQEATVAPSPEHRVTFNEDEYTKITTPRQDVLFKKGYLGRRRTNNPTDAQELHSADSVESEYIPEEQPQFAYVPPTGFIDHTGVLYVNSSTYELYDPYSGNVTVVVGPAPQYPPQPVLAAMPCQPVPLTPLEWFNPPAPWMCPYNNRRKRYSTDSQNCSAQSSESTGPPGSPQEPIDDGAGAMFPPQPAPYMYPGYMFGAPVYNMNGVNVQGVMPQPPVPVNTETPTTKRRKKRRRRRRGGVTDEGSESSCEEVTSCDVGVCSQSGASSDAGQGSTCSKTNSDSGINTEPTPDSGSNTPPPMSEVQLLPSAQNFDETTMVEEHNYIEHQQPEIEVDLEPISSSVSTPEAHKCTFESLPSEDGETLQELSCSSESYESKLISYSSDFISCSTESNDNKSVSCLTTETDEIKNTSQQMDHMTDLDSLDLKASENSVEPNSPEQSETELISCSSQLSESQLISNDVPLNSFNDNICNDETIISSNEENLNVEENKEIKNVEAKDEEIISIIDTKDVIDNNEVISKANNNTDEELLDKDTNVKKEDNKLKTKKEKSVANEKLCNGDILRHEECMRSEENTSEVNVPIKDSDNEIDTSSGTVEKQSLKSLTTEDEISCSLNDISLNRLSLNHNDDECKVVDEIQRPLKNVTPLNFQLFPACHEGSAPVPPPRRRRSLYRSAEKVAKKIVDEAVEEGTKEAACIKCEHSLPITEAVTRWLQSQGPNVLSPNDSDEDEDEGIEDGEGSTNQKNVEGNPFLAPYLSGSRKRVADSDDCGSLVSSAGEWDMYDHESHTRAICDPATSVDKYYRLGADDLDDKAPTTPSMIKTAVHIRRAGPFPCGVCCIIQ